MKLRVDAGTVVLDDERGMTISHAAGGHDVSAGWRVADRVLDQIQDQSVQVITEAVDRRRLGVDSYAMIVESAPQFGCCIREMRRQVRQAVGLLAAG